MFSLPGASYSSFRLGSTFLVGVSHEPTGTYTDPNLYLYGSDDGGRTFSPYFSIPWDNPGYTDLTVQYAFPNGDFSIRVTGSGYGTIIGHLTSTSGGGDLTAPLLSSVAVSSVSASGAVVSWLTDEPADSQVEYGPTASYGSSTSLDASKLTSHTVSLSSLVPSTVYHYRVKST